MKKELLLFLFLNVFYLAQGQSDIFDASRQGDLERVQKLVQNDNDLAFTLNDKGYSPLVLACYYGHKDVVEYLISKVDNVNTKTDYGTPLMAAAVKGFSDIVDVLLANGADPNITDVRGETAAHYAVLFRNYQIIKSLKKANADFTLTNTVGKSPMDYVIAYNDEKINTILNIKK